MRQGGTGVPNVGERSARWASAVIVVLYLALGVAFSVVNPLFESPDEALNYANVRFFAEERRLPTVEPGERIVTVLGEDGATRFYGSRGYLGTIEDPGFGPALLGIWLHPETRVADLRADLIGGAE